MLERCKKLRKINRLWRMSNLEYFKVFFNLGKIFTQFILHASLWNLHRLFTVKSATGFISFQKKRVFWEIVWDLDRKKVTWQSRRGDSSEFYLVISMEFDFLWCAWDSLGFLMILGFLGLGLTKRQQSRKPHSFLSLWETRQHCDLSYLIFFQNMLI